MKNIRVLVVDPDPFSLSLIEEYLETRGLEVVGKTSSIDDVMEKAIQLNPSVLILGIKLNQAGLSFMKSLAEKRSLLSKVVVLVEFEENKKKLIQLLRFGVNGIIFKNGDTNALIECICAVHSGKCYFEYEIRAFVFKMFSTQNTVPPGLEDITKRELEIISLVIAGYSRGTIATRLGISSNTVDSHLSCVFMKLGVDSRSGLVWYIHRRGACFCFCQRLI